MSNLLKNILVCLAILTLGGCSHATDRTLSPPSDTRWVNVEVKNPSRYTRPFPLEVLYISNTCKRKLMSMRDGSHYEKPGYNPIKIPLQQQGSSDIWRAKVAMIGGGSCDWRLSEFTLGIEYTDATHLGKDLVPGTAVGATIAFDDAAARNGKFISVHGDLQLAPKYYPYITEWHLLQQQKDLSLLGKLSFLSYRVFNTEKINFNPSIDETKIVRYIEPFKKEDGVYSKIIYPDGSVAPERTLFPDFDKVDKMEVK